MTEFDPRPGHGALVESFDDEHLAGWVEVGPGATTTAPAVQLYADELCVATAFAGEPAQREAARPVGEVRAFHLPLDGIWDFVGPRNRLSVRHADTALPIAGHGMVVTPRAAGTRPLDELAHRLAAGEAFNKTGRLQLPKSLDEQWQRDVLALYSALRADVAEVAGSEPFLTYGTLLGSVREGGFIGHDLDFDAAVLVAARDAAQAARELQRTAFGLIDRGYEVRAFPTFVQVARPERPDVVVDLFHLYFDGAGTLCFPHGVASSGQLTADDWSPPTEREFGGTQVLVPAPAEAFLGHVYGADWTTPDPSFSWARDRVTHAADAVLPAAVIEEIYWANFYARTVYDSGSSFFELVDSRADLPRTVVDIGCGDGRDSYAFAAAGWNQVTGLDRSHVGVRQATRKAEQLGYGGRLSFDACDVGDAEPLRRILQGSRSGDAPMVFYARFFLHSIPEDVQRTLMNVVADCARPGDWFAAEFRTDRDEAIVKVHGNHYRRFQNGVAFGRALRESFGFTPVLEQEGNGFSPYKGEDPQLYRVIARCSRGRGNPR